jgi:two-component system LytT family sensor kinase
VTGDRRLRLAPVELLGIAAFWTAIAIITALGSRLDPRLPDLDPRVARGLMSLAFIEYAMWAVITGPVIWLASRYSVEGGRRLTRVFGFIAVGVVVAVLVDFSLGFFRGEVLFPLTDRRPGPPPRIAIEFLDDFMVYLAILGTGIARDYFLRYRIRADEMVQLQAHTAGLQAQLAKAELSVLRSQLNPHFLFNTLHAISVLALKGEHQAVAEMLGRLSDLLRAALDGTAQEVPLSVEMDFVDHYMALQRVRFADRLIIEKTIPADTLDGLVPTMILQPLVENAIKHGVNAQRNGGHVNIKAERSGGDLIVEVQDTGPGFPAAIPARGIGLANTKARLEQLYGAAHRFEYGPAPQGGASVRIVIPFRERAA